MYDESELPWTTQLSKKVHLERVERTDVSHALVAAENTRHHRVSLRARAEYVPEHDLLATGELVAHSMERLHFTCRGAILIKV
jgi:hypothetical protein